MNEWRRRPGYSYRGYNSYPGISGISGIFLSGNILDIRRPGYPGYSAAAGGATAEAASARCLPPGPLAAPCRPLAPPAPGPPAPPPPPPLLAWWGGGGGDGDRASVCAHAVITSGNSDKLPLWIPALNPPPVRERGRRPLLSAQQRCHVMGGGGCRWGDIYIYYGDPLPVPKIDCQHQK